MYTSYLDAGGVVKDMSSHAFSLTLAGISKLADEMEKCIIGTRRASKRSTPAEMIICDADNYHPGMRKCQQTHQLIRKEVKRLADVIQPGWTRNSTGMLRNRQFYKAYYKKRQHWGKALHAERLHSVL